MTVTMTVTSLFPDRLDDQEPALSAAFEAFWRAFPKRVGKPIAKAKFMAIVRGGYSTRTLDRDSGTYIDIHLEATPQQIIDAAKRYEAKNRKPGIGNYSYIDDGKYLMHPATWLNRGAWEDG